MDYFGPVVRSYYGIRQPTGVADNRPGPRSVLASVDPYFAQTEWEQTEWEILMADDVITLPVLKWEIPKPKKWDFIALAVLVVGIVAATMNVMSSGLMTPGASVSQGASMVFSLIQLVITCVSLLVLGKTAKEGTIHGNLFALGAMGVGLGGMMLAAALWAIA